MKKILTFFVILLFLSCAGQKEDKIITIIFKHGKVAGQSGYLTQLIREFEAQNPDIEVKEEILPSITDQQHQFYVTSLVAGSADFDVLSMDVIWIAEFAQAGWIENLSGHFTQGELDNFLPGPLKADIYKDQLFAVPWYVDGGLLYYRKDLLEKYNLKPPRTFKELEESAHKILQEEKNPNLVGFIWQGKQYEGLVCAALEFIFGNCAQVLDSDGKVVINSKNAIFALNYMRSLIENKIAPEYVTTTDEEATRHSFGNGRAVFMRNWLYAYNIFQSPDSKVKDKIGISIIPHFEGCQSASTLGGWQLGINRFSKHKKEAWRFIKFMSEYESQKLLAIKIGLKPSRKDVYQDEELTKVHPFIIELYNVLTYAQPRPVSPYYPQISLVLQEKFSKVLSGTAKAEKVLDEAEKQISEILSR